MTASLFAVKGTDPDGLPWTLAMGNLDQPPCRLVAEFFQYAIDRMPFPFVQLCRIAAGDFADLEFPLVQTVRAGATAPSAHA
jgi:hypothetical protein